MSGKNDETEEGEVDDGSDAEDNFSGIYIINIILKILQVYVKRRNMDITLTLIYLLIHKMFLVCLFRINYYFQTAM